MKCDACGTDNRDAAKFCKGCGGKLAQAWRQPPLPHEAAAHAIQGAAGIVLTGQPLRPEPMPPEPAPSFATAAPRRGKGLFVVAGLAVLAVAVAALVWTQRGRPVPEAPAVAAASTAPAVPAVAAADATTSAASATPSSAPATPAAVAESAPPAPATASAAKPARKRAAPKPVPPPVVEAPPAPPAPAPEPVAPPAPQTTCGALNFIAKARCMAAECAKPGVSANPQCEAVRRQQRIDEEKRNPSGG